MSELKPEWLIRKGGYFYRPNAQGYTASVLEAGLFTKEDAIRHSFPNGPDGPRDGITYHHQSEYFETAAPLPAGDDGELVRELKLIASRLMGRKVVDGVGVNATCDQAADRIAALNAEVARLAAENRKMRAQIMSEMLAADADLYTTGDRHE